VKDDFALRLLVPKHTGKTLDAQPTLYWWVSQALSDAQFTLILDKVPENTENFEFSDPLVEIPLLMSVAPGIQALPLSKIKPDFRLEKDVEYQWTLLIACHPEFPSLDIKATGSIMRVEPNAQLSAALSENPSAEKLPALYAQHGIWYNAIGTLSEQILKSQDKGLRKTRANLLEQVGLSKVANNEIRQLEL
jgi:hypothetical protein